MSRVRRRRRGERARSAAAAAQAAIEAEADRETRRTILARFARLHRRLGDGLLVPEFCGPRPGEVVGGRQTPWSGNDGKPIFDSEADAAAAAAAVNGLASTGAALRPYVCPRSAVGGDRHFHLTSLPART